LRASQEYDRCGHSYLYSRRRYPGIGRLWTVSSLHSYYWRWQIASSSGNMKGNAVVTEHTNDNGAKQEERAWFANHTYSGYENKVKSHLEARITSMNMRNKIFRVIVPMEEEVEIKQGQRRTVQRKVFPGYVLVEMVMSDEAWYVVRNTPGVTSFVGS